MVLTGDAGSIAGGYVRNGTSARVGLVWPATPGPIMTSAMSNDIGATVSYGDQAIAVRSTSGGVGYETVASMTVTGTGGEGGWTELLLNYATFS